MKSKDDYKIREFRRRSAGIGSKRPGPELFDSDRNRAGVMPPMVGPPREQNRGGRGLFSEHAPWATG